MLDTNDLLNAIKKAALDAVNTSQPSDFCFGKVVSVSPLKISIEQKMALGSAQLILTRNVTDYKVDFRVEDDESSDKKQMTVYNALKVNEKVILLKQKGGQRYLVLDRVVNT